MLVLAKVERPTWLGGLALTLAFAAALTLPSLLEHPYGPPIVAASGLCVTALTFSLLIASMLPTLRSDEVYLANDPRSRLEEYVRASGAKIDLGAMARLAASNTGLRKPPRVALIRSEAANAASLPIPSRILLLTGTVKALAPEEVEAVLEHECAHLKLKHQLKLILTHSFLLALLVAAVPGWLLGPASAATALIVHQALLRRYEAEADGLVKSKAQLASALSKLSMRERRLKRLLNLLFPHPPVEERIERLKGARK